MPELCCLEPSSLNRPHPPHSWAHRDFTARRIRDVFAVRERRGDLRVVPSFRCTFLPDMPSSSTPGSSDIHKFQIGCRHWPSPNVDRLGTPKTHANPFHAGGRISWLIRFAHCCGLPGCLPPLNGSDRITPTIGDFYFWASNGSVTLPASRYDYNSDWTPLLAGLSPAGMAASLAARSFATKPAGSACRLSFSPKAT